jgi:crotonobetainyl-CoA:carnitine CoA-transferase CaiB-like acyl-CoA transferase
MSDARGPLDGIRVVSVAEQYPGPFATLLLGDLGADVVQIERPSGDPSRAFPGLYEALNRGKRSVVLDLKQSAGVKAFRAVVSQADVLLEGFRPGVMDRLGLGAQTLRAANPRLVYVSVSGFGQDGPYRDRPAHDLTFQAMTGVLEDGRAAPRLSLADLSAGVFAAIAALTGLAGRASSGMGGYYDVAMFDSLLSFLTAGLVPVANGRTPDTLGQDPGYALYATSDNRWVSMSIAFEDHFWRELCDHIDLPQLADVAGPERVTRRDEIAALLAQRIAERSAAEWDKLLTPAGVPFGIVRDLREVVDDPQVRARDLLQHVAGATALRQPLVVDGVRLGPRVGTPQLGQHTREVLAECGIENFS